ncbi:MAG TPA: c-type cytochrome [Xanthobacteraceae bacterium]
MIKNRFPTIFRALFIFAAALTAPANAADEIEAKLQACGACHGQNGVPLDPKTIPIIWGQTQVFLVKQLHDYRAGDRNNPIMAAMAKTLSQEELRPAAAYLEKKPWPARQGAAPAPVPVPNNITVCQACHQQGFVGGMPAPRLAGQSYEYLIKAMNSFADGTRTNNMDMVKIMQELSAGDRDAIAHYIASL